MRYDKRLKRYLTGNVALSRRTGEDEYGAAVYGPEQVVPARIEARSRLVRTQTGALVTSQTTVYLCNEAAPLDKIDGREVLSASIWTDRQGNTVGYEAAL